MKDFLNTDCLAVMKQTADNYFDLAIVDPPYGIGISSNPVRQKHDKKTWDNSIPEKEYFTELLRVSKNQIIWGGNYFDLPPSQGFLIWDKKQPEGLSLAMCEYAWSSIQSPAKMFRYSVQLERGKIHPTQKPEQLYKWILRLYAKPDMRILDTHVGSASSLIAFEDFGCEYVGFEIDADYYAAAVKRLNEHKAQMKLF